MFNETKISPLIFNFTKTCMPMEPTLLWSLKLFFTKLQDLSNMYANEWSIRFTIYRVDGSNVGVILPSCQTQRVKVIDMGVIQVVK